MTLRDWKQNEQLCAWAMKTFQGPHGREFLRMMEDSHPRLSVLSIDASDTSKVSKLGMNDGYQIALNHIEEAFKFKPAVPELEATFGAEMPQPPKRK